MISLHHLSQCLKTSLPRRCMGWRIAFRPIAVRESGGNVFRVAAEFQDVPLSNAHVLNESPGRVRCAGYAGTAQLQGKIGNGRVKIEMGAAAAQRGCPTTAAGSRAFAKDNPALFQASGFADHPYAQGIAPNTPTIGPDDPRNWRTDPDYADLPEVPRLEGVLDRIQRIYRSNTRFPIWNTEYGYRTRPPDPHATIGQATAAYYMNWAEYLSWRQKRLVSYSQYLLYDPVTRFFASGLLTPAGKTMAPRAGQFVFVRIGGDKTAGSTPDVWARQKGCLWRRGPGCRRRRSGRRNGRPARECPENYSG